MRALVYGNLTLDKNTTDGQKYEGPGGSAFFVARTLQNLGGEVTIVSPYGKDYHKSWLKGVDIIPSQPTSRNTLIFHNFLTKGKRVQTVEHLENSKCLDISKFPKYLSKPFDLLFLCPIIDNINIELLLQLKNLINKKLLTLLVSQGFFRKVEERGNIVKSAGNKIADFLPLIDIVTLSEKDTDKTEKKAQKWSLLGPTVIVTKADKGCILFDKGNKKDFPAFPNNQIIDETGAGDVFSAAFGYAVINGKSEDDAARFANATASISLSYHSSNLKIHRQDVYKLNGH